MTKDNIVLVVCILVPLCWVAAGVLTRVDESVPVIEDPVLHFDRSGAAAEAREFSAAYPDRTLGSIEARQSTGFLKDRLEQLGYQISYTHFDATVAGKRQVGRNVLAFRQGPRPEILAVAARYDNMTTAGGGGSDNAAGIGVLLELARVFSEAPARHSLLVVALDGNSWGALGARDLAENHAGRRQLAAVISLDRIDAAAASLSLATAGQFGGGAPAWLRSLARRSAAAAGIPFAEPGGFREHMQRALPFTRTDQGPFLRQGIPAVNLGAAAGSSGGDEAADGLDAVGVVAEIMLRSMDGLQRMPGEQEGGFRLHRAKVLSPAVVKVLHYLAFAPFAALLLFHWRRFADDLDLGRLKREFMTLGATLLPFLLAYYFIRLMDRIRLLPRYSLYPPSASDAAFAGLQWKVLAGLAGVVIVAAVVLYFIVKTLSRRLPRPDFNVSKLICLVLSGLVALAALMQNGYWAVSFLLLPALVAGLAGAGGSAGARAANRLLLVAAMGVPCALFVWHGANPHAGMTWLWWELIALAGGMYSMAGYFLAGAAVALGIRYVTMQSYAAGR